MRGADAVSSAVLERLSRTASEASQVIQEGVVTQTSPYLAIELTESRVELAEDEITLSQDVTARLDEVGVGDAAVLTRKRIGGEIRWVVVSVTSDAAPSRPIKTSLLDAKGDLIVATADDTPSRLAVGTDGQALIADSTQAKGVKWASIVQPVPRVTALPTTGLVDGMVVDLMTVAMQGTWGTIRCEYRGVQPDGSANAETYKWHVIGGGSYISYGAGPYAIGAGGGLFGPVLAIPIRGIWRIGYGVNAITGPGGRVQITYGGAGLGGTNAELEVPAGMATSPSTARGGPLSTAANLQMVANNGFATTGSSMYDCFVEATAIKVG